MVEYGLARKPKIDVPATNTELRSDGPLARGECQRKTDDMRGDERREGPSPLGESRRTGRLTDRQAALNMHGQRPALLDVEELAVAMPQRQVRMPRARGNGWTGSLWWT